MQKKGFLASVAGILAASFFSLSGKPYPIPAIIPAAKPNEIYFRQSFGIKKENAFLTYTDVYGRATGSCSLRLDDILQIEDNWCDNKIERIYINGMKVANSWDDGKEIAKYLWHASRVMDDYKRLLDFDSAKERWLEKRPKTLKEELPSYIAFLPEKKETIAEFWVYGFRLNSSFGLSTKGDYHVTIYEHDAVGKLRCELRPRTIPEAPGIAFTDYGCDGSLEYFRDSLDVKKKFSKEEIKEMEHFYKEYKKLLGLDAAMDAWHSFQKEQLKRLDILRHYP